jgi:glycosyltransferase involved in cell wall biosynthesis
MGDFYRSNHVLICASQHEGGPLPIVESLACGRPVITTSVGIVPEIVNDGENGIIISRKRSSLRDAIEAMLEDKELVNRLASSTGNALDGRYAEQMAASYDAMFEFVYRFQQEEVR